jgi:VanZ family protein
MAFVILLGYLVFHFQNLDSMLQTLNYIQCLIFIKVITCMWKLREKPGNVHIRQQFARTQLTVRNLTNSPEYWFTEKTMETINGPLWKIFHISTTWQLSITVTTLMATKVKRLSSPSQVLHPSWYWSNICMSLI